MLFALGSSAYAKTLPRTWYVANTKAATVVCRASVHGPTQMHALWVREGWDVDSQSYTRSDSFPLQGPFVVGMTVAELNGQEGDYIFATTMQDCISTVKFFTGLDAIAKPSHAKKTPTPNGIKANAQTLMTFVEAKDACVREPGLDTIAALRAYAAQIRNTGGMALVSTTVTATGGTMVKFSADIGFGEKDTYSFSKPSDCARAKQVWDGGE